MVDNGRKKVNSPVSHHKVSGVMSLHLGVIGSGSTRIHEAGMRRLHTEETCRRLLDSANNFCNASARYATAEDCVDGRILPHPCRGCILPNTGRGLITCRLVADASTEAGNEDFLA